MGSGGKLIKRSSTPVVTTFHWRGDEYDTLVSFGVFGVDTP